MKKLLLAALLGFATNSHAILIDGFQQGVGGTGGSLYSAAYDYDFDATPEGPNTEAVYAQQLGTGVADSALTNFKRTISAETLYSGYSNATGFNTDGFRANHLGGDYGITKILYNFDNVNLNSLGDQINFLVNWSGGSSSTSFRITANTGSSGQSGNVTATANNSGLFNLSAFDYASGNSTSYWIGGPATGFKTVNLSAFSNQAALNNVSSLLFEFYSSDINLSRYGINITGTPTVIENEVSEPSVIMLLGFSLIGLALTKRK